MLVERQNLEITAVERRALLHRLAKARQETDKLFALVRPSARYTRPIAERHRIVFYLGHLEAFDWNLLQRAFSHLKPFDSALDRLFAFGIDPVDPDGLPTDTPSDWPEYPQVRRYGEKIRELLDEALLCAGDSSQDLALLLNVAIEHRLMHAETLAYMLHQLPYQQKIAQQQGSVLPGGAPKSDLVEIPDGRIMLGLQRDGAFGWDNEFDAHCAHVAGFAIDRYKVTNADYRKFVEAGGYQERSLWTAEAWAWKSQNQIDHPVFWQRDGNAWLYRGMFEQFPLPPDWPVFVSYAEAHAYAAWAEKRLPSEAEWQHACYGSRDATQRQFPWGELQPGPENGYFDFARWDPSPVNAWAASESAFGVQGALANGWEWTSSVFAPFAGFQPFPFYEGYSANFFDGKHFVLKGGSPRTDQCMLRRSFRNWFQPHYQYVYAGFRCARNTE